MSLTPSQEIAKFTTNAQVNNFYIDKVGIVIVSAYGAIGDGVTDDTIAVQAAVDAAQLANTGEVHLVSGKTYKITSLTNTSGLIFIGSNVTIVGGASIPITSISNIGLTLAGLAYNVTSAGCSTEDTGDCGTLLNAVSEKYLYFPAGTYRITTTWVIDDDNVTIIFHPQAKIHVVGSVKAITISGDYCKIYGGEIYSGGSSTGNGYYGIEVLGDYSYIDNVYIHDISYIAIMNDGKHNTFTNILARNMGWDLGGNYTSAADSKWYNCKAFLCKRHGFSTDTGSANIHFIDCYAEDIGNPALAEGHSFYHFEGSDNGKVTNCVAKLTSNSPYISASGIGVIAARIEDSANVIIEGLEFVINADFVPTGSFDAYWAYVNHTSEVGKTILYNCIFINNSNSVSKAYIGGYANIHLDKCSFTGYFTTVQVSLVGYIKSLQNCTIDGIDKTYTFYDAQYSIDGLKAWNNKFKNIESICKNGVLKNNCSIKYNTVENCTYAISTGSSGTDYSRDSEFSNNLLKDITTAIKLGYQNQNSLLIMHNIFTGTFTTILDVNFSFGVWKNNRKGDSFATTNYTVGSSYTTIDSNLLSSYDIIADTATVQSANPDTSGATLAQLETEVNQLKAALRAVKVIAT